LTIWIKNFKSICIYNKNKVFRKSLKKIFSLKKSEQSSDKKDNLLFEYSIIFIGIKRLKI